MASRSFALPRRYDFVEQREHSSMAPHVIDIDECGAPMQRTHGFDGKVVRLTAVIGDLVRRHNQCAQTATLGRAVRHRTDTLALCIAGNLTSAPSALIGNKSASLLDNLELKRLGQSGTPVPEPSQVLTSLPLGLLQPPQHSLQAF